MAGARDEAAVPAAGAGDERVAGRVGRDGWARQYGIVVWPAFVAAGLLEILVFAFVDPSALRAPGGGELEVSATAVYSVAFFAFWVLVAATGLVVLRLAGRADAT